MQEGVKSVGKQKRASALMGKEFEAKKLQCKSRKKGVTCTIVPHGPKSEGTRIGGLDCVEVEDVKTDTKIYLGRGIDPHHANFKEKDVVCKIDKVTPGSKVPESEKGLTCSVVLRCRKQKGGVKKEKQEQPKKKPPVKKKTVPAKKPVQKKGK